MKIVRERIVLFGFDEHQVAPPEATSGAQARVASVARLIAREAWRCASRLTPRQRAQYDVDDLTQEAWVALLERDRDYDPKRYPPPGGYVVFARLALRRHFRRVTHRYTHAVQIPRKFIEPSSGAEPHAADVAAYERARKDPRPIRERSMTTGDDPVPAEAAARETARLARDALRQALGAMPDRGHARLLRRHYGLLGEPERPVRGIVYRELRRAEDAIRAALPAFAVAV